MKAVALHSATASLLLTTVATAPAGGTARDVSGAAEPRGTTVAALRAGATGMHYGACDPADVPPVPHSPAGLRCGTVSVPLDYARPTASGSG